MRRLLPAVLLITAACAKGDTGATADTAKSASTASTAPAITSVCPASASARTAALVGVISNARADKAAEPVPPMPQFKYPDELAQKGIGGKAIADFVVDTAGLVDMNSVEVRESTDSRITEGVCHYLAASRFSVAEKGGKRVRVQREIPFNFAMPK
jgi:outer membrane biosynthesis protein TonB